MDKREKFFDKYNYKCTCHPGYNICLNCHNYYNPFGRLWMIICSWLKRVKNGK